MQSIDRRNTDPAKVAIEDASRRGGSTALWAALSADRRARDERTARLRAMRLIAGEDATAAA